MDDLLHEALERAFLHDDPLAYEAGVHAAFRVLLSAGLRVPTEGDTAGAGVGHHAA
ncbi:MAG TPA: hypothetical protein VK906_01850 [Egicoccus sp.]|nr:hypothetical protein [Egicoccus sp.]HSK21885.1 hypothetical protein [Egicoccus sp.]